MDITFRLWKKTGRQEPEKGWNIMADICWNGYRVRKSTQESCPAKFWKGKNGVFVSDKMPYYYLINEKLSKLQNDLAKFYHEAKYRHHLPLPEEVVAFYDNLIQPENTEPKEEAKPQVILLIDTIKRYQAYKAGTENATEINKDNYLRFFKQVIDWLQEFEENIPLEKVGSIFLSDYANFLLDNELENNTVQAHIKRIKTVINYCRNVLDLPIDKSYKEFSMSYIEPDIVFLLPHEIDLLRQAQFKEDEKDLEQARDFFLFGCYVGARYADLVSFTMANILHLGNGKVSLQYRPKKTPNVTVNVSVVKPAWEILEKYAEGKKLLPTFRNDEINNLIKDVAKRVGINTKINRTTFGKKNTTKTYFKYERLTMHCSRHTFATICFMRGMKELEVQNFLGHTNTSRTKRYIHLAEGFKTEAMEKVWDWMAE